MFTYALLGLAIVVLVFVIVVSLQPAQFRVERSAIIAAPAEVVFLQVNDLHRWEAWSPWARRDPAMKQTYEGPPSGTGAVSAWAGNREVGEGRMTITESRPAELVRINLEFLKPFKATSTAEFKFKLEGTQTVVTWSMFGQNNFLSKAFHMFMNMDKMIGGDFEKGLAGMKTVSETVARS